MRRQAVIAASLSVFLAASAYAQSTAFFDLAKTGTPQQIQAAVSKAADVGAQDTDGFTALMDAAAFNPSPDVINILLKAGAEIEAREPGFGRTPLMLAAQTNKPEVVSALLKAGADPTSADSYGATALIWAATDNPNPDVITILVKAGASLRVRSGAPGAATAICWAAAGNNAAVVSALLDARADPNDSNGFASNLIMAAMGNPNPGVITVLLKAGADPKAKSWEGKTAFDYAKDRDDLKGTEAYRMLEEASK
jgi:ankyrin repeat protein